MLGNDHHKSNFATRLRDASIRHKRQPSLVQRGKWAYLYKPELDALIQQLAELVESLEGLFEAGTESKRLAEQEVNLLKAEDVQELLKHLAEKGKKRDEALMDAIKHAHANGSTHKNTWNGANQGGIQADTVSFGGGTTNFNGRT